MYTEVSTIYSHLVIRHNDENHSFSNQQYWHSKHIKKLKKQSWDRNSFPLGISCNKSTLGYSTNFKNTNSKWCYNMSTSVHKYLSHIANCILQVELMENIKDLVPWFLSRPSHQYFSEVFPIKIGPPDNLNKLC